MKLIECKDWKVVHFQDRTIFRSDRNLYPESVWWGLIRMAEVEPMTESGHYKAI